MKKLLVPVLALAIVAMYACGGSKPATTPEEAVKGFFEKLSKLDIKGAKKYATKESASFLDMMEMGVEMAKKAGKDADSEMKEFKDKKFEVGTAKINGDEAKVPVTSDGSTRDITVKKEGGSWKVAFDKSTMMNDSMNDSMKDLEDTKNKGMEDLNDLGDSLDKVLDNPDVKKVIEDAKDPKELKEEVEKIKEN